LHATEFSGLSRVFILRSTAVSLLFVSILIPIFGYFSDRSDRLQILMISSAALVASAYPFMVAINSGNAYAFIIMQLLISIPCASYYSVSSVILTELFPIQIRCTTLSIVFSIAASLASGFPPLIANWLVQTFHRPNAPSIIMMVMGAAVLINAFILKRDFRVGRNRYTVNFSSEQGEAPASVS